MINLFFLLLCFWWSLITLMGDPTVFYNFHSALPCLGQRFLGGFKTSGTCKGEVLCPKCLGLGWSLVLPWSRKGFWYLLNLPSPLSSLELTQGCKGNSDFIHFPSCWRKQELNLFRAALELALGASRGVGLGEGGLLALRATAQHCWLSVCPFWDISWPQTSFAQSLGPVCSQGTASQKSWLETPAFGQEQSTAWAQSFFCWTLTSSRKFWAG